MINLSTPPVRSAKAAWPRCLSHCPPRAAFLSLYRSPNPGNSDGPRVLVSTPDGTTPKGPARGPTATGMRDYSAAYAKGMGDFTTDHVLKITGHQPRSIELFAREVLAPALQRSNAA